MKVLKYSKDDHYQLWNDFVKKSKNGHFFFQRNYMDYHSDRFKDHSLMVFDTKDKLLALFPANLTDSVLYSHQGLTFGGLLVDVKMKTELMLNVFEYLLVYAREQEFLRIIYKCVPYIYHRHPSDEDRYALFIQNAKLIRRDVSSTINLLSDFKYSKGRKWSVNKARKENLCVFESNDYDEFWSILTAVLDGQHGAKPVHSLTEIKILAETFPDNIKLYLVKSELKVLSGALMFVNDEIVHTQYLANSGDGREIGALDFLLDDLIKNVYADKKYFDFGISNEDAGKTLNTGLIAQKEGFGARPVVHDFYELVI